jgi:PAS domain S-box-containing protein
MRLATVSSQVVDRATAWTLAGCLSAAVLLVWLGRVDYSESSSFFHPHGYCYLWLPSLVSTHVISDLLIGLSYVAISATLVFLVWKARRELPFSWMFIAFGAFIVCCGATHFMEIWTLWTPVFWLAGGVKIVTAVASVATAVALPPLIPRVLALVADARLSEQRRLELEQARAELERRVAERTRDLESALSNIAQAEEGFRAIVETALDAVVTIDAAGTITGWSPQAESTFGWKRQEALGRSLADLIVPERFRDAHRRGLDRIRTTGESRVLNTRLELSALDREGREFPIELSITPLGSGRGTSFSAFVRDITERKRMEQALIESQRHYQALAESLPHLVWTCRPDGYCDYLSRQWVEYTGRPAEEQLGSGWAEQLHPEDRDRVQAEWAEATIRGGMFDVEFRIRRADGVYRWFKTRAVPLRDDSGTVRKWFGSNTDVEDYRQALDDLRRSNADLEQFAYVASHDLQEPLRMVASYTDLLAQRYRHQLDERANTYIHFATDGAKRMQRLVTDLLAYSRVGSQSARISPVKAGEILRTALKSLDHSIRESDARIEIVEPMPVVLADEGQLSQVFQNLIGNAIKFRSEAAPRIRVQASLRNTRWVFAISDNGIGIDMRYAERIFQMFQRLHERGQYDGSGIGLAITKRIVERHGGQIWLKSAVGAGTTFFFTVPIVGGLHTI